MLAIGVTIIDTGIVASHGPGGLSAVDWSLWPPPDTTFYQAFLATTNIVFAYSFAVCQYSFMAEMHTPKDYVKSICWLGGIEIFIYTVTGALIYAFVGSAVNSPAILSAGPTVSRIAFGIALPVIFISGSINTTVTARYIMTRAFKNNSQIAYIKTGKAWVIWIALVAVLTVIAFAIAEAIPFFNALLGLISSLFISGFTFYFPALFWWYLIRERGNWGTKNIALAALNGFIFTIGIVILVCGTYASVMDIKDEFKTGSVGSPFTCDTSSYM